MVINVAAPQNKTLAGLSDLCTPCCASETYEFRAVDTISYSIDEGECFVPLGHNGAGKSTTINMLTGNFGITEGDARVFGNSVASQQNIYVSRRKKLLFLYEISENLQNLQFFRLKKMILSPRPIKVVIFS